MQEVNGQGLPNLARLKRLLVLLRDSGVARFRCGGLEIELAGPLGQPMTLVAAPAAEAESPPAQLPPARYRAAGAVPFDLIGARAKR